MKIRPLQDRILVERLESETKTQGGLYIPDTAKEKPAEGTVVAAGKGRIGDDGKLIPMELKIGDRVLFSRYGGNDVKLDGKDYLIMGQDDILCVVEE